MQLIKIAKKTARRFLKHPSVSPLRVIAHGNALYALERLPITPPGASSELGIVYRNGTSEFREMRYIKFSISGSAFELFEGGSAFEKDVRNENFSVTCV